MLSDLQLLHILFRNIPVRTGVPERPDPVFLSDAAPSPAFDTRCDVSNTVQTFIQCTLVNNSFDIR
jgi:hypothetical protein